MGRLYFGPLRLAAKGAKGLCHTLFTCGESLALNGNAFRLEKTQWSVYKIRGLLAEPV